MRLRGGSCSGDLPLIQRRNSRSQAGQRSYSGRSSVAGGMKRIFVCSQPSGLGSILLPQRSHVTVVAMIHLSPSMRCARCARHARALETTGRYVKGL